MIELASCVFDGSFTILPVLKTIDTSRRLSIVLPYLSERLPLALVAIMPPIVQYGPTDGFGPRNFLCLAKAASSFPLYVPPPTST